jgi:exodeoxyribonuclease VII large subunit
MAQVADDGMRLWSTMRRMVEDLHRRLDLTERALGDPARVLEPLAQRLDERTERLTLGWQSYHERRMARVTEISAKLRHPRDVLELARQGLKKNAERLTFGWKSYYERSLGRVMETSSKLRHPRDLLALAAQRLANFDQRRAGAMRENILRWRHRLEKPAAALHHLSPKAVLGRGYALVQDAAGRVVISSKNLEPGERVKIEFHDGSLNAAIEKK